MTDAGSKTYAEPNIGMHVFGIAGNKIGVYTYANCQFVSLLFQNITYYLDNVNMLVYFSKFDIYSIHNNALKLTKLYPSRIFVRGSSAKFLPISQSFQIMSHPVNLSEIHIFFKDKFDF